MLLFISVIGMQLDDEHLKATVKCEFGRAIKTSSDGHNVAQCTHHHLIDHIFITQTRKCLRNDQMKIVINSERTA